MYRKTADSWIAEDSLEQSKKNKKEEAIEIVMEKLGYDRNLNNFLIVDVIGSAIFAAVALTTFFNSTLNKLDRSISAILLIISIILFFSIMLLYKLSNDKYKKYRARAEKMIIGDE